MIVKVLWDLATKPAQRKDMLSDYFSKPLPHIFMTVWMVFFIMFFVGIFAPIFGEINLTDDGWQVWEVGIFGFFGMFLIDCFFDVNGRKK